MNFLITVAIGSLGGYIGLKSKVPAGALIGSIISAAALNIATGMAYFPQWMKIFSSSLAGAYIGARINKKDIIQLRLIIKPAIMLVVSMMVYNIFCGFFLSGNSEIDLTTALISAAPGGTTEMALVAIDMGGNPATVSAIQLIRLFTIVCCAPIIFKFLIPWLEDKWQKGIVRSTENKNRIIPSSRTVSDSLSMEGRVISIAKEEKADSKFTKAGFGIKKGYINLLFTVLLAIGCGAVGYLSGFPAGALVFSMIAVGALNITKGMSNMPMALRRAAQALNGTLIGLRFHLTDLVLLKNNFIPIAFMTAGWLIVNVILGILLCKWGKLSLKVSLFAASAGGMTDMGLIAEEMGANTTQVAVLQLSRLISVICLYPPMIKLITGLF